MHRRFRKLLCKSFIEPEGHLKRTRLLLVTAAIRFVFNAIACFALVLLCVTASANARGAVVLADPVASINPDQISVLYCLDSQGTMTLSLAKRCQYLERRGLRLPITHDAVLWVKLTTTANPKYDGAINVLVGPHLIRSIEIFDGRTDALLAGPVGTGYPFSAAHGLLGGYTFVLDSFAGLTATYYLRIATNGLPYAFVEASRTGQASGEPLNQQVGLGIHLGALGLLLLASVSVFAATRNRVTGCFALVILNLLLATLAGSGFLFMYVWGDWPRFNEVFFNSMFYLRVGLWVLLAQTILMPYQTPGWYRMGCWASYLIVAIMLLLSWFGFGYFSNILLLFVGVTLIPVFQVAAIYRTRAIRPFYKQVLAACFAIGAVLVWLTLLITVFVTSKPDLSIQFTRLVDYVNPLILLALVVFHYRETARQLADAKKENLTIRLGLEFERKLKDERKILIDMLTHELKNPLATISLAIGSLASTFSNSQTHILRRLQNIDQSVRRMDSVIERCNLMNQLDQCAFAPESEDISLSESITRVIDQFPASERISFDISGEDQFATDPQLFHIVISNLLDNALKYSPIGTPVSLSLTLGLNEPTLHLHIKVTNQIGTHGLPDKEKVFTRFYRNPLALDKAGSGVGLYLVKTVVDLLQGKVDYRHTTHDVTFVVVLPEIRIDA
jgi:signal transduction histidine kinase